MSPGHHVAERRQADRHPPRDRVTLRVDLHTHSTASDGALSPAALVEEAARVGLDVLALTDHDTLAGCPEAIAAGARTGVEVLSGIELSVRFAGGQFHLLGWFREVAPRPLGDRLGELGRARAARNAEMLRRLAAIGAPVDEADVRRRAAGQIGRPHIADALIAAGHARDREDAFTRLIGIGCPGFVPTGVLEPAAAITLVTASGGVACLAHPRTLALDDGHLDALVGELAEAGLDALEAHRGDAQPGEPEALERLAARHGLLAAGGSDYHGPARADRGRRLGETGEPGADPEVLAALVGRVLSRRPA